MASNNENGQTEIPILTDVIREDLISTAVKFLTNENVQKSPVSQREAFLRKKGLNEKEIAVAFERSLKYVAPLPQQHYQGLPPHTAVPIPMPQGYLLPPQSGWSRFRDIMNTVAIVGGFVYGLYVLYKRYIAPFLFGKKRSPIEESIASLDVSVKESVEALRVDVLKVQSDLEKINNQQHVARHYATSKQVLDVKAEITSLKGLFLSRKRFPGSSETSSVINPASEEASLVTKSVSEEASTIAQSAPNETSAVAKPNANETSSLVNSPTIEISSTGIPTWQSDEMPHDEVTDESFSTSGKANAVLTNGNHAYTDEV